MATCSVPVSCLFKIKLYSSCNIFFTFKFYLLELVSNTRRLTKERTFIERFLSWSLFDEEEIKDFKKTLWLNPGLWFFYARIFNARGLLIKSTFYVYIGTVKFSSLFKESTCSPEIIFTSFFSEGHGVQPRRGTPFFHICVQLYICFFSGNLFLTIFQTKSCKC